MCCPDCKPKPESRLQENKRLFKEGKKKCKICSIIKSITDYNSSGKNSSCKAFCKDCQIIKNKTYYSKNSAKWLAPGGYVNK